MICYPLQCFPEVKKPSDEHKDMNTNLCSASRSVSLQILKFSGYLLKGFYEKIVMFLPKGFQNLWSLTLKQVTNQALNQLKIPGEGVLYEKAGYAHHLA